MTVCRNIYGQPELELFIQLFANLLFSILSYCTYIFATGYQRDYMGISDNYADFETQN